MLEEPTSVRNRVIHSRGMVALNRANTMLEEPTSVRNRVIHSRGTGSRKSQVAGVVSAHQPTITKAGTVDADPISHLSKKTAT
jgi:hypothetical protein